MGVVFLTGAEASAHEAWYHDVVAVLAGKPAGFLAANPGLAPPDGFVDMCRLRALSDVAVGWILDVQPETCDVVYTGYDGLSRPMADAALWDGLFKKLGSPRVFDF